MSDTLTFLKNDLVSNILTDEEIFQKHIVDGQSFFFSNSPYTITEEYKFKSMVAKSLGLDINQVVLVGSAKLGFSLNPKRLFQPFDSLYEASKKFNKKSDLDVAIISHHLFDRLSKEIYDYTDSFNKKWTNNLYYTSSDPGYPFDVPLHYKYHEYFSKGWFRPDLKPNGYEFCSEGTYQDLKSLVYKNYKRKIGLGIYKDWHYFKSYHLKTINNLILMSKRAPL